MNKVFSRTIRKSFEYDKFKKIRGNREINPRHVKSLKEAMVKNYVPVPAIVNEHFALVDGQHRLEACRELELPFFYYIVNGSDINDVTSINRNRKNWGFTEWMNRYASNNFFEYQVYKTYFERWGFDHWSTIFLLCRTKGYRGRGKLKQKFEDGTLKIETLELGKRWAKRIMDIEPYYANFRRRALIQAMIRVFHDRRYDHKLFIKKLSPNRDIMYDCSTVGQYLQRIDDIFNKGSMKKNRVDFYHMWGDPDSIFQEAAA